MQFMKGILESLVAVAALIVAAAAPGWAQEPSRSMLDPSVAAPPAKEVASFHLAQSSLAKVGQSIPTAPTGFAIVGSATVGGGRFFNIGGNADAWLGNNGFGIQAWGMNSGGRFANSTNSGVANVGYGDVGILAAGNTAGGIFIGSNASGTATVGDGDTGIVASGNAMGANFSGNYSGVAHLGVGDYGIMAWGNAMGGYFINGITGTYAYVATGGAKITGNGAVSFVQNHPTDSGAVIVYTAPEGDEVATYTRGTARLINGEAHVTLGDTFQWVTNPDIGLTAQLTPHGEPVALAVTSLSTTELDVRGSKDAPDGLVFDYVVYGLRIGFEQTPVVREKTQQSFIPSMKSYRDLLSRRPDFLKYTAFARFNAERKALGIQKAPALARAGALKAAIHEFDPAVDKIDGPDQPMPMTVPSVASPRTSGITPLQPSTFAVPAPHESAVRSTPEIVPPSVANTQLLQPATSLAVSGGIEPGDVLVVDREHANSFTRGVRAADPAVVGVVLSPGEGATAQVAFSGIARCKVDANFGSIAAGDLLVSAPTPGYAMRDAAPLPGTVVGKALEPLAAGQGTITILVMLR